MKLLKALILLAAGHCFGQIPSMVISNETVVEGEVAQFTVTLSEPSATPIELEIIPAIGYNYNDFNLLTPTITFPAGQTIGTFLVATTDDNFGEATEYGELCPYVNFQTNCGILTILDNDPNIVGEVIAQADNLTYAVGIAVPFYNVLSNDTINGIPATVDSVALTTISIPPGLYLSERGQINLQGTELPGIYVIEYQLCAVSDPNNCSIGTITITLFDPLKVENFAFQQLKIFPNPAKNNLSVSNATTIDAVEITTLIGQTTSTKKVNDLQTEIDVTALPTGIYFLKISSDNQQKMVKFVKE